jgi:hypothetical protein
MVLEYLELPLSNNLAERGSRHRVIAPCISYGTRNHEGLRAFCRLASVIEACCQRGHLPWAFVVETVRESRKGNSARILAADAL